MASQSPTASPWNNIGWPDILDTVLLSLPVVAVIINEVISWSAFFFIQILVLGLVRWPLDV